MKNQFQNLRIFNEAHSFVLKIYEITKSFPSHEIHGLTSQIRRASVSVVANIVEGNAREKSHKKEVLQFLHFARGSLEEVKYFLLLSKDLRYITHEEYNGLQLKSEIVGKMLWGLIKSKNLNNQPI